MSRRVATVIAALGIVGALAAVPATGAAAVGITTATTPGPAHFGDVLHATITVRADAPAQVQGGFSPYEVLGSRSTSTRAGGVVTTTWTFDLQCLDPECAPGPGPRRIALAPSRVLVGSKIGTARFAPVVVETRATANQVANPERFFLHPTAPPPPVYRTSPTTARSVLFVAAALLALVAAALLWPLLRPCRAPLHEDRRDALAHALALVRAACSRPPPDRRRALGLLSRTLRRRGDAMDSRAAADLAWSEPEPDSERMRQLADRVERTS